LRSCNDQNRYQGVPYQFLMLIYVSDDPRWIVPEIRTKFTASQQRLHMDNINGASNKCRPISSE
jgi:hypothetical protein